MITHITLTHDYTYHPLKNIYILMMSWHKRIFRITGPLCGYRLPLHFQQRKWCCKPTGGLYNWHGLTLIQTRISNPILNKLWYEITYLFSNFNGRTVGVWELVSNVTPNFITDVIINPCRDESKWPPWSARGSNLLVPDHHKSYIDF